MRGKASQANRGEMAPTLKEEGAIRSRLISWPLMSQIKIRQAQEQAAAEAPLSC
jgi:hypothetical protein